MATMKRMAFGLILALVVLLASPTAAFAAPPSGYTEGLTFCTSALGDGYNNGGECKYGYGSMVTRDSSSYVYIESIATKAPGGCGEVEAFSTTMRIWDHSGTRVLREISSGGVTSQYVWGVDYTASGSSVYVTWDINFSCGGRSTQSAKFYRFISV